MCQESKCRGANCSWTCHWQKTASCILETLLVLKPVVFLRFHPGLLHVQLIQPAGGTLLGPMSHGQDWHTRFLWVLPGWHCGSLNLADGDSWQEHLGLYGASTSLSGFDCDPFSLEGSAGSLLRVFPTQVAADHLNSTCILNAFARRNASSKRRKRKRSRTAMFFWSSLLVLMLVHVSGHRSISLLKVSECRGYVFAEWMLMYGLISCNHQAVISPRLNPDIEHNVRASFKQFQHQFLRPRYFVFLPTAHFRQDCRTKHHLQFKHAYIYMYIYIWYYISKSILGLLEAVSMFFSCNSCLGTPEENFQVWKTCENNNIKPSDFRAGQTI